MHQQLQGVRRAKVVYDDAKLLNPTPRVKHKDIYLHVFDAIKKAMYTNQSGRFPITSSKGNKYLMVAVKWMEITLTQNQ